MKRPQYASAVIAVMAVAYTVFRLAKGFPRLDGWGVPFQMMAPGDLVLLSWMSWLVTAPFLLVGIWLTARRLRDLGWPISLAILYAVPWFSLPLIVILMLVPARGEEFLDASTTSDMFNSAVMAAVLISIPGAVLCAVAIWLGVQYGWALFVGLPFLLGMASAGIYGHEESRRWSQSIGVACLSLTITGVVLLLAAVEGAICLAMAAPIAYPLAILGGTVGYFVQRGVKTPDPATTLLLFLFIVPMTMGAESAAHLAPPEWIVYSTIEIDAPPEEVWKHVIEFPAAPPPHELAFRAGIAYPIRAALHGSGVGAMRSCDFSTGSFIETIDVWEPGRRMEFSIVAGADPMTEMTPYPAIHPPHLDGYLHPRHAIFELTPLPGGRTRLDGTSYYRDNIWPALYWRFWSDAIIHTIHARVFEHIKRLSEAR